MGFAAVVCAAGVGSRCGGAVPKQFRTIAGRSLLEHAVRAFTGHSAITEVWVVLAPDRMETPEARAVREIPGVTGTVAGGAHRAESVLRGLEAVGSVEHVLVHDAARPFVSRELVRRVVAATREHGAAVPLLDIHDTVKRRRGAWVVGTADRDGLGRAQTPQGARLDWLLPALSAALAAGPPPTDESAALERAGRAVAVVAGEADNRKITRPDDLGRARQGGDVDDLRVGTGFDIHRVSREPGREMRLGGVRFEGVPGLAGHSDADVVLHAAMDAVLGAAGLPDIGVRFPPEDETFRGADSRELAREVSRALAAEGFRVVNLDLMLLAERPKIRPRVAEMREAIAACFGIDPARVGVKATTLETLGALGRGEGVACQATALLARA